MTSANALGVGRRYLVNYGLSELTEVSVTEVAETAVKLRFENGRTSWVELRRIEIVEELKVVNLSFSDVLRTLGDSSKKPNAQECDATKLNSNS